jgi:hypothetical protein
MSDCLIVWKSGHRHSGGKRKIFTSHVHVVRITTLHLWSPVRTVPVANKELKNTNATYDNTIERKKERKMISTKKKVSQFSDDVSKGKMVAEDSLSKMKDLILSFFPRTTTGVVAFNFWHSAFFTMTTPLYCAFQKNWRGDLIVHAVIDMLAPARVTKFLEDYRMIHPGLE